MLFIAIARIANYSKPCFDLLIILDAATPTINYCIAAGNRAKSQMSFSSSVSNCRPFQRFYVETSEFILIHTSAGAGARRNVPATLKFSLQILLFETVNFSRANNCNLILYV